MSRTIHIVQGSTLPRQGIELYDRLDDARAALDISQATAGTLTLRQVADPTITATLPISIDATTAWLEPTQGQTDTIAPGLYQGQITLDFAGQTLIVPPPPITVEVHERYS